MNASEQWNATHCQRGGRTKLAGLAPQSKPDHNLEHVPHRQHCEPHLCRVCPEDPQGQSQWTTLRRNIEAWSLWSMARVLRREVPCIQVLPWKRRTWKSRYAIHQQSLRLPYDFCQDKVRFLQCKSQLTLRSRFICKYARSTWVMRKQFLHCHFWYSTACESWIYSLDLGFWLCLRTL